MSDPSTADERIVAHLGFARAVASRALDPRCRGADREDLIADGVVGLVHAGRKMEPLRRACSARDAGRYTASGADGRLVSVARVQMPYARKTQPAVNGTRIASWIGHELVMADARRSSKNRTKRRA